MGLKIHKSYPIDQCALFKLHSKRKLSTILGTSLPKLLRLIEQGDENYHQFEITPTGRKPRTVQHPKDQLQRVHTRLFNLLRRVTPPAYLHSGVKGRSYVTNAKSHIGEHSVRKLDIKSFYPSTKFHHIHQFFRDTLLCSPDVANILTRLTTVNDHVPTGSCISQALAFYAHLEMFNKMYAASSEVSINMTVYVDDVTFSGKNLSDSFIFIIKKIIHQRGLAYHKERSYHYNEPKLITGVIINKNEIKVPNKLQQAIHKESKELQQLTSEQLRSLTGKCNAAAQIEPKFLSSARRVRKRAIESIE